MSRPTVQELDEQLKHLVNWERLAIHLPQITLTDIDIIKQDSVISQKQALFEKWLQVYPNASWDAVVLALEEIDENSLAEEIRLQNEQRRSPTSQSGCHDHSGYECAETGSESSPPVNHEFVNPGAIENDKKETKAFLTAPPASEIGPSRIVDPARVKKMILFNHVPLNCFSTVITGLPYTWKSTVLDMFFERYIKENTKKTEDKCMKLYDVRVSGAYPYNRFTWFHTPKESATVFFILSDLIRISALRQVPYREITVLPCRPEDENMFGDHDLDKHFQYLYKECHEQHQKFKKEESNTLADNAELSLSSCLDIGVSKAVYDILPLFAMCFRKSVRFVFFSLSRDFESMNKPPDLTNEKYNTGTCPESSQVLKNYSRLEYICRFAFGSYHTKNQQDSSQTIMVAVHSGEKDYKEKFEKIKTKVKEEAKKNGIKERVLEWVCVNPDDPRSTTLSLKSAVESKVTQNNHFHTTVSLKWFFLRSLIAHKDQSRVVIHSFNKICMMAEKLEMNEEDVRAFLTTFTDFASLLYCPHYRPLRDYVITDIEAFMELLDVLYHPQRHEYDRHRLMRNYGIVLQESAEKMFGDIWQIVMSIMVSLGLAAKLTENRCVVQHLSEDLPELLAKQASYFMPNIRDGPRDIEDLRSSMFIQIDEKEKSENEAALSQSILTRHPPSKVKLIPSEEVNCTKLKITLDSCAAFEIHILYHGNMFEFRLVGLPEEDPPNSSPIISACTTIIEGCCKGLTTESNFKKGVHFSIVFKCLAVEKAYYYPFEKPCSCEACRWKKRPNQVLWWTKALNNCKVPLSYEHLQQKKEASLNQDFIAKAADRLTNELLNDDQEKKLKTALNLKEDDFNEYHGWRLFSMMFIIWEKNHSKTIDPKQELREIIKEAIGIDIMAPEEN